MGYYLGLNHVSLQRQQVITIGVFDGVHLGHQFVIQQSIAIARQNNAEVTVVTFWPSPIAVVRPGTQIRNVMHEQEKRETLAAIQGVDHVIVLPFTHELASLNAIQFLEMLLQHMPIVAVVEGDDFRLGHNREGGLDQLRVFGKQHGFNVEYITRQMADGGPISSTRIRNLLEEGNIEEVTRLLSRPYYLEGIIVHGDQRGRALGFPTANLMYDIDKIIPANGIYAVYAWTKDHPAQQFRGTASIGVRPTFNGEDRRVEVFLLDYNGDLYDQMLCMLYIARLRNEEKFASVEALIGQMNRDVTETRRILDRQEMEARV